MPRPNSTQPEELQNAILNAMDVNLALLDKAGCIIEVSESWKRFAEENGGPPESTGVGVNYLDVCRRSIPGCPDALHVLDGIQSVMSGAAPLFAHEYWCNAPHQRRWFVMTAVPRSGNDGGAIVLHRNDSQLIATEARYGKLLDSVRAIIWRAELPGFRTTFASKQIEEILGFPALAWTGDPEFWKRQTHPDDLEQVMKYMSQETAAGRSHAYDFRMIDAHGSIVWLRNRVNVIVENGEAKEVVGISTDVTERMQAVEERDRLAIRLLRAQEEERSRIARELHDDIGQSAALLSVRLGFLKQALAGDNAEAAMATEAHALANKLAQDVQRISHGLHSSILELAGLASAVKQHCREYGSHSEAEVQFDIGDIPGDLDRDVALCLFRILQESLRNVIKHSQAKHVTIRLFSESDQITLEVCDDGIGFNSDSATAWEGLGLASMKERMRLVNGRLTVLSSPGEGTRVTATVPFRRMEP